MDKKYIYVKNFNDNITSDKAIALHDKLVRLSRKNNHKIILIVDKWNLEYFISIWPISYIKDQKEDIVKKQENMLKEQIVFIDGYKIAVSTIDLVV